MLLVYFVNLNYQNKNVFISIKKEIRLKKHIIFVNLHRGDDAEKGSRLPVANDG